MSMLLLTNCSFFKNKKLLRVGSFEQESFSTELPFKLIHDFIVVEVTIDEKAYNFIYDTGAEVSAITPELTSVLGLKKESSISVSGSNNSSERLNLFILEKLKLNNTGFTNLLCVESELNTVVRFLEGFRCGVKLHGLIGNNLMKKATWKIDYENEIITFWDNNRNVAPPANSSKIPFEHAEYKNPKINVKIDSMSGKFTFDTGSGGYIDADKSLAPLTLSKTNAGKYAVGVGTSISINNTKTFELLKQKIPIINLGGEILKERIISFEENGSNLVGNKFWKNYLVTIDWKNSVIYLENRVKEEPATYKAYQYGISKDFTNRSLSILEYWTSHPYYKPIHPNNEILSIENEPIKDQFINLDDFCDFVKTRLPQYLKKDTLQIEILENGKRREVQLIKEVIIK